MHFVLFFTRVPTVATTTHTHTHIHTFSVLLWKNNHCTFYVEHKAQFTLTETETIEIP